MGAEGISGTPLTSVHVALQEGRRNQIMTLRQTRPFVALEL
jgi:hypothetical protein